MIFFIRIPYITPLSLNFLAISPFLSLNVSLIQNWVGFLCSCVSFIRVVVSGAVVWYPSEQMVLLAGVASFSGTLALL